MSALVYILALISCVTVGKLLNSAVCQFSPCAKRGNKDLSSGGCDEAMHKARSTVPAWHMVNLQ